MKELQEKLKNLVLVYAEDDDGIRKQYQEFFSKLFKEVHIAGDGDKAYSLYDEYNPDIIIADIRMPGMDGLELTKKVRENDKDTRVLITTAYTDEKYTLQAIELNITRYLVKPVSLKELKPALEKCYDEFLSLSPDRIILCDNIFYDYNSMSLFDRETEIPLTNIENSIIRLLIDNRGSIVRFSKFESEIWNSEFMSKQTLRAHIKSLRRKLPEDIIQSIKGIGYSIKK